MVSNHSPQMRINRQGRPRPAGTSSNYHTFDLVSCRASLRANLDAQIAQLENLTHGPEDNVSDIIG